ncbi:tRNA wybutosine-synthesizing protein 3 homolog [Ischnura elegans]|uniref:tRNA wybutosine-synthesizing protein 3 homolog n=1 Tax=Ischnura elegans TaxID=197161 RepID=UPI001ED896FC|nr:tRNA wybutosine-synthesizing protein 3 homolog [Ischnura elegans]
MTVPSDFSDQKKRILCGLDNSRKGSIDSRIESLVCFINDLPDYVTTSSCSGRIIMFCLDEGQGSKKKGCKWLYTSHDLVDEASLISHLNPEEGNLVLKFEPLILHVRCSNMESAKALLTCSLTAGFKNSGFVVGKQGSLVLAVRSCLGLEVPLSKDGIQLVSNEYIKFLAEVANEKMTENFKKTDSLFIILKEHFESS